MDIVKELKSNFFVICLPFHIGRDFFPRRDNFMGVFGILIDNRLVEKLDPGAL